MFRDNGFELEFPSLPAHNTQKVKSDSGELSLDLYLYQPESSVQDDNILYSALTILYPGSSSISDDTAMTAKILRGAIDGGVSNIKGKIMSESTISYKGFPGRDVHISFSDNNAQYILSINVFLIRNKIYLLQVACAAGKQNNTAAKRFLHSFKLTV